MVLAPSASGKSHYVRTYGDAIDGDTIVERVLGWPVTPEFTASDHLANWAAMAGAAVATGMPVVWNGRPFWSPALLLYVVIPTREVWRKHARLRAEKDGRPGAWGTEDSHYDADTAAIQRYVDERRVRGVFSDVASAVLEAKQELAALGIKPVVELRSR
jgi:hypothetical protein